MITKRINTRRWFLTVIVWDGILPAFVVLVPSLFVALAPNGRSAAIEYSVMTIPFIAFFIRIAIGVRHITLNSCSEAVSAFQFFVFLIGIVVLLSLDGELIIAIHAGVQAVVTNSDDTIWLVAMFLVYLAAMVVAMFPGQEPFDATTPKGNRAVEIDSPRYEL